MIAWWARLPLAVRAVVAGVGVTGIGTLTWSALAAANLRWGASVPWAVAVMAPLLWLYWRYFAKGAGPPRTTAAARIAAGRAHSLRPEVWALAMVAGLVGLWALVAALQAMNRMIELPPQQVEDLSGIPLPTVLAMLTMASVVAGVTEETGFRGYLQGTLERAWGPVAAILATGLLFGLAHFTHPEVGVKLLPFYLAVAAIYGTVAYLTNSILPGIVLHAVSDVFGFVDLITRGQSEWQRSATPAPLIWDGGADAAFWTQGALALGLIAAAVFAYVQLARVARAR